MKPLSAGILSFGITLALGAAGAATWLGSPMAYQLKLRLPGSDRPAGLSGQDVPEKIEGKLTVFDGKPMPKARGVWPCFRGATREGISDDMTALADAWPAAGPPVAWAMKVGEGHAGAAILKGKVYLHDYDAEKRQEVIRCMSLADGKDIWAYAYKVRIKRNHGVSRTVPAVTDEHLLALGPKCHVTCLDSNSGQLQWAIDLVTEYGTKIPPWYAGQCPMIDDGNAILAPCGNVTEFIDSAGRPAKRGKDVLMTAIRCKRGPDGARQVVWEVPNTDGWQMTHSSIAVLELEDYTKVYVYCGSGGVVGVGAEDGKVLFKTTDWKIRIANVPTPVAIREGNKLFLCGGYGAGSMMLQILKEGDVYVAKVLVRNPPAVFGSQQQTPVFYKNHLFGTRVDEQFVCLSDQGQVVWTSGPENKFGKEGGGYVIANDKVFALDDDGVMTMFRATPQSYQQLARAKVLSGHHSWGPVAAADGLLICRDLESIVCLDLRKQQGREPALP
jgi:outer membrane protein assembly factor BamB